MTTWLTRRTATDAVMDLSLWAQIDVSTFSHDDQQVMTEWRDLMDAYVMRKPVAEKLRSFSIDHTELLRKFNKCISLAEDGRLFGYRGLLPNAARKEYERSAPVRPGGNASGALCLLLKRKPEIQKFLDALILKRPIPGHVHEARIMNKDLHVAFVSKCRDLGVEADEWPFTGVNQGRRSIDAYVAKVVAANLRPGVLARYGDIAGSKLCTGTGEERILLAAAALDVAEMDAHRIDMIGVVGLPTSSGTAWIPIDRLVLLLACDAKESTILSFFVAIQQEADSNDLLEASRYFVIPWKPRDVDKIGMEYLRGGGIPLGSLENMLPFGVGALMLDNALIHLGLTVVSRISDRLGCAVNWGRVRKWMRRPIVERIFRALEQHGFQRIVSTTGSSPMDTRRKDASKEAAKHRLMIDVLLDLIDVEVAAFNGTPSEGRFALTPNEALASTLDAHNGRTLFPLLPPPGAFQPELDVLLFGGRIYGDVSKGRRPSIKFKRAKYTNPSLANSPELIGKEVILHVRRGDIRTFEAFLKETGASLGVVKVLGAWRLQPHSLDLRMLINKLLRQRKLDLSDYPDPVTAVHAYLAKEARSKHQPSAPRLSSAATELAREAEATGLPIDSLLTPPPKRPEPAPNLSRHAPQMDHSIVGARHV